MGLKKGYGVVCTIVLYVVLMVMVSGVVEGVQCGMEANTNRCYTITKGNVASGDRAVRDQVCVVSLENEYQCMSQDAIKNTGEFDTCCKISGYNGVEEIRFITTKEAATKLRDRFASGLDTVVKRGGGLVGAPATQRLVCGTAGYGGTKSCKTLGITKIVGKAQPAKGVKKYTNAYCGPDEVVCSGSFVEKDFSWSFPVHVADNRYVMKNTFQCCKLEGGIELDQAVVMGKDFVETKWKGQQLCDPGFAMCGFRARSWDHPGSGSMTAMKTFRCCAVKGGAQVVMTPSHTIPGNAQGSNQYCQSNEVVCGVDISGEKDGAYISGLKCCPFNKCDAQPNCAVPSGDANCNDKPDGEEDVCKEREAGKRDDDDDGIQNSEDKCPNTPQDEIFDVLTVGPGFSAAEQEIMRANLGCGPSEIDADKHEVVCKISGGSWIETEGSGNVILPDKSEVQEIQITITAEKKVEPARVEFPKDYPLKIIVTNNADIKYKFVISGGNLLNVELEPGQTKTVEKEPLTTGLKIGQSSSSDGETLQDDLIREGTTSVTMRTIPGDISGYFDIKESFDYFQSKKFKKVNGVCCGGDGKIENFVVEHVSGQKIACLGSQEVKQGTGGKNIFAVPDEKDNILLGNMKVPPFKKKGLVEGLSEAMGQEVETNTFENNELVLPPGKEAQYITKRVPDENNRMSYEIEARIPHGGQLSIVRTSRMGSNFSYETTHARIAEVFNSTTGAYHKYRKNNVLSDSRVGFILKNTGGSTINIKRFKVFDSIAKRIFFQNGEFFSCGLSDGDINTLQGTNPTTEEKVEGEFISGKFQPECPADSTTKIQDFCTFSGWENIFLLKDDGSSLFAERGLVRRTTEKQIPSLTMLGENKIGISRGREGVDPRFFPSVSMKGCCPENFCWSGSQCIRSSREAGAFTSGDGKRGIFCSEGEWEEGRRKPNVFETEEGLCAMSSCFHTAAIGDRQARTCVNDGKKVVITEVAAVTTNKPDDAYCDNGKWASRPAVIAKILSEIPGKGAQYTIHCDAPDEVLLNKAYTPVREGERTDFEADHACVLEYGTHAWKDGVFNGLLTEMPIDNNNVIVALALRKPVDVIKAGTEDAFVLSAFDAGFSQKEETQYREGRDMESLFTYCLGAYAYQSNPDFKQFVDRDYFTGCTGVWDQARAQAGDFDGMHIIPIEKAQVWYSKKLATVMYSPKEFKIK